MGGDHGPSHAGALHGHHSPLPKIPDPKEYRIEAVPELMAVKRALASKGLKDPWLRNEVWKYGPKTLGTRKEIFGRTLGRGMLYGFIAAVITTAIGKAMGSGDHDHGHEKGHH